MNAARVLAYGAVSALGQGARAFSVGELGQAPVVAIGEDREFLGAGLARPVAARAVDLPSDGRDRATQLLATAMSSCLAMLETSVPDWRARKIGLALGTSSGGMLAAERLFAAFAARAPIDRALARAATYFGPLEQVEDDLGLSFSPRVQVLGACASSTLSVGLATRWLRLGHCELAIAGGYDALSVFVASGFEALRATTATRPRPFRVGRDGLALGEGAAVVALAADGEIDRHEPAEDRRHPPRDRSTSLGTILGFGASTDAVHLTAPDRTGRGMARAVKAALDDAGLAPRHINLVSAHATATVFNDAAEASALARALEGAAPAAVHPFKAQIGHTLGAAGLLESLAALDAVRRGLAPAAAGEGEIDLDCALPLRETNERLAPAPALKLSSAFGGANAALVLAPEGGAWQPTGVAARARPHRAVFLRAFGRIAGPLDPPELLARLAGRHPHVHRLDRMARLVLSAVSALSTQPGYLVPSGSGVILGHALATLEHNELFDARRRERGPRLVEPRRFPATSPNAAAGECAIAFQLTGPSFAVGASLHGGVEALAVARDLIACGDAPAMLVVAADLHGPLSAALLAAAEAPRLHEGACAVLLSAEPLAERARRDDGVLSILARPRDFAWTAPGGHEELFTYLTRVAGGRGRVDVV